MSVTQNLGKVSVTPKGQWSSGSAYEKLDIVTNSGCSYMALQSVPAGTALTNPTYWQEIAGIGPQGDAATIQVGTVTTVPSTSPATVTNSGTQQAAVFNFGIPKGADAVITKQSIIDALNYTPADYEDLHGSYHCVEISSLSQNVFQIERSKCGNVPYDFQSIILYFETNDTQASSAPKISLYVNSIQVATNLQPIGTAQGSKGYIFMQFIGDMLYSYSANQSFISSSSYEVHKTGIASKENMFFRNGTNRITRFKLVVDQNTPFVNGSEMFVYVRK